MEDRESVIHLRNLSLQPASNEEEGEHCFLMVSNARSME